MPPVERTEADYTVSSASELRSAMGRAMYGDVIWVDSNITTSGKLGTLQNGAVLASDGATTLTATEHVWPYIAAMSGSRVTGLRIQGPIPVGNGLIDYGPVALGVNMVGSGVEVDRCELYGWGDAAIYSRATDQHVHDCDIHHNRQEGIGYGVGVGDGGEPLIEYNTFSHNRHDVSSVCDSCSYEVRYNLHQTPRYGTGVDVHRPGGDEFRIHHNEDRNASDYAVAIRGTPNSIAEVHHNWYFNPTGNVASGSNWPSATVIQTQHGSGSFRNVSVHDNHYGSTAPPSGIGRGDGGSSPPDDNGGDGNGGGHFDPPPEDDDGGNGGGNFEPPEPDPEPEPDDGTDGEITITDEDMQIIAIASATMFGVYIQRGLNEK